MQNLRPIPPVHRHPVQRNGRGEVQQPAAEGTVLGLQVFDGMKINTRKAHRVRVPVKGVFSDTEFFIGKPVIKDEGTVAYQVARTGPRGTAFVHATELLYGRLMYREPGEMILHAQKIGCGILQFHLQCFHICRESPHLVKIPQFTLVIGPGVFETVQHVGIF